MCKRHITSRVGWRGVNLTLESRRLGLVPFLSVLAMGKPLLKPRCSAALHSCNPGNLSTNSVTLGKSRWLVTQGKEAGGSPGVLSLSFKRGSVQDLVSWEHGDQGRESKGRGDEGRGAKENI